MTATQTQTYTDAAGVPIGRGDMAYGLEISGEMTAGFIDALFRKHDLVYAIIGGEEYARVRVYTDRVNALRIALNMARSSLEYHRIAAAKCEAMIVEYEAEGAGR